MFEIGQSFVDTKMRELKEVAEKEIDHGDAQGEWTIY